MAVYETSEQVIAQTNTGDTVTTRSRVAPAPVPDEHPQEAYHQKKSIFRAYQIVWYIIGIIEVLLGFRVVLRLMGANPASGFANLIYGLSLPLASPFTNLFGIPRAGQFALEPGTLIGMLVYFLIGLAIVKLMQMIKPTTPEEVDRAVSV
jgi:hypothetical protein